MKDYNTVRIYRNLKHNSIVFVEVALTTPTDSEVTHVRTSTCLIINSTVTRESVRLYFAQVVARDLVKKGIFFRSLDA